MAIAGTPKKTAYPFSEIFEVTTSGTSSVTFWDIPAGTIITRVLAKIKVAGTGSGNLTIGDDDAGNVFVLAGDATAAADVIYGDDTTELGAAFYDSTKKGAQWKVYTAAGKEMQIDCSAALTTEATVDVFVFGYRYAED